MTSRNSDFERAFKEPRSARQAIFTVSSQAPMGSILHCVLNRQIFCKER